MDYYSCNYILVDPDGEITFFKTLEEAQKSLCTKKEIWGDWYECSIWKKVKT